VKPVVKKLVDPDLDEQELIEIGEAQELGGMDISTPKEGVLRAPSVRQPDSTNASPRNMGT
jgi:hypothetical protein